MKLTELLICIAIFVFSTAAFLGSLITVNKNANIIHFYEKNVNTVIDTDLSFRKEIRAITTCYWKNFSNEIKDDLVRLEKLEIEGVKVLSVKEIEEKHCSLQGIQIDWEYKEKKYVTREYIKVRVDNDKK